MARSKLKLKYHPALPAVAYPADWSEEQIIYLERAYTAGFKRGMEVVRTPILEALGIHNEIDDAIRSSR